MVRPYSVSDGSFSVDLLEMCSRIMCLPYLPLADSEYYKSQALKNAKEAYQIHQARVSGSLNGIWYIFALHHTCFPNEFWLEITNYNVPLFFL